jgi:hypothetical protein
MSSDFSSAEAQPSYTKTKHWALRKAHAVLRSQASGIEELSMSIAQDSSLLSQQY